MGDYNRFGATVQGVVDRFPGASVDALGGAAGIEGALDEAEARVAAACPTRLFDMLTTVEAEFLTEHAQVGQMTFAAAVVPVSESAPVYVWKNHPHAPRPPLKWAALAEGTDYSKEIDEGSLVITLTTALGAGDTLLVTYSLDREDEAYGFGLLKNLVEKLAAVARGTMAYGQGDTEEANVASMREAADKELEQLRAGSLIPHELRGVKLCADWEPPESARIGSVQLMRG